MFIQKLYLPEKKADEKEEKKIKNNYVFIYD